MNRFELSTDCETIHEQEDLTIFYDSDNVERAVYCCDMDGLPLPHCDPSAHGFALIKLDFIAFDERVAIAEVTHLASLMGQGQALPMTV